MMKTLMIALVAMSLTACATVRDAFDPGPPATAPGQTIPPAQKAAALAADVFLPAPESFADRTTKDETAGRLVTLTYTALSRSAALAIRTRLIRDPATIRRIGALDDRGFALVMTVRQAYLTGNAPSYAKALKEAHLGLAQFESVVKGATR